MYWHLILRFAWRFVNLSLFFMILSWIFIGAGAAIVFMRTDRGCKKTLRGFLRFLLPSEIITMKSCRIDAVYYLTNKLTLLFVIGPLIIGNVFGATLTYQALTAMLGPHPQRPVPFLVWVFVAVVVAVGTDFATFYTHYLDHKIRVLWEFHKVHHAPEFLIPITNQRFHPVQRIFDHTGEALMTGTLLGISSYVFSIPIYDNTIIGIDAYYLLNVLSFHHLRHSHINMGYGWLEKWILSPAQHHLHHSQEGRHWDKNFGLFLSVWDRWFGTLVYSEPRGSFRLGLPEGDNQGYSSVLGLYTTPFVNIWHLLHGRSRLQAARSTEAKNAIAGDETSIRPI